MTREAGASPRVVVRGMGSIGQRHARVFRALGAEVLIWPVRPREAEDFADDLAAPILDDDAGLEACGEADLVVIATDTSRHVSDAVLTLDLGAARVLVEKPVAPTLVDTGPLRDHRRSDRVFVAAPLRAHQCFHRLRARLVDIGEPRVAYVYAQSWLPDWRPSRDYRESYSARPDEGGVLRDLVHEIDYVTMLWGPPDGLSASLSRSGPLDMLAEQSASLLWRTPQTTVLMQLDYITRPTRRGITVTGPNGTLTWDVPTATVRSTDADGTVVEVHYAEDLDRDHVMTTQARAMLQLGPRQSVDTLLAAGAPATLAQGCLAIGICDAARSAGLIRLAPREEQT